MYCLIVDDEENNLHICGKIISSMGFETKLVNSAEIAMEMCKNDMPSIIILDWKMPYMSGIDFLHELRDMIGGSKPSVLMCTSNHQTEDIKEALDAGANEYIMKPFDKHIMQSKLQRLGLLEY